MVSSFLRAVPVGIAPRLRVFLATPLLIALLFSLGACHSAVKDPKDPNFIVAESKDWKITRGQLDQNITAFLAQRQKTIKDVDPAQKPLLDTEVLDSMVVQKLVLARAEELHLPDPKADEDSIFTRLKGQFPTEADFQTKLKASGSTVDDLKKRIREEILFRKTVEQEAFQNVEPTDADINAFYLQNQDKLSTPEKIRASRVLIMVDDKTSAADRVARKKAIDKAHARVAKGEDFAKVATEVSEDRYSAPKGGDLGYQQKGENEAGFDDVAFAIKPGQLSPVFQTAMGYQFLKVTDVHPSGVVSIAQARDKIAAYLRQVKQSQAMNDYAKKLLAQNNVTFHLVRVDPSQLPGASNGGQPGTAAPPAGTDNSSQPPVVIDAPPGSAAPAPTSDAPPAADGTTPPASGSNP